MNPCITRVEHSCSSFYCSLRRVQSLLKVLSRVTSKRRLIYAAHYIGVYHSNSWQANKDCIRNSLKGNGMKRVIVATTALCMGVNFPDIRYIIEGLLAVSLTFTRRLEELDGMVYSLTLLFYIMDSTLGQVRQT